MLNQKNIKVDFRINRGIFKGTKLFLEKNHNTRPSKSLVKKSFFDTMQSNIEDKVFIECFAGSGQIGFEALSMNANKIVFFEKDSKAFVNLSKNIKIMQDRLDKVRHLGQDCKCEAILSYNMDFFNSYKILESILTVSKENSNITAKHAIIPESFLPSKDRRAILYIDPPFNIRSGFSNIYCMLEAFIENLSHSLVDTIKFIIIESISDFEFKEAIHGFTLYKTSKFGKTTLRYFKK